MNANFLLFLKSSDDVVWYEASNHEKPFSNTSIVLVQLIVLEEQRTHLKNLSAACQAEAKIGLTIDWTSAQEGMR